MLEGTSPLLCLLGSGAGVFENGVPLRLGIYNNALALLPRRAQHVVGLAACFRDEPLGISLRLGPNKQGVLSGLGDDAVCCRDGLVQQIGAGLPGVLAQRPSGGIRSPEPRGRIGAGPGGHTQRLLTVVKSGSIQDVKATPVDKVHTWPHLLAAEFVSALAMTAFVFIFSVFVHAPLLQLANTNQTPNPSKAPWYFLGLQELLVYFHPMVAGVTLPGVGLIALVLLPYLDRNPSNKRRLALTITRLT